MIKNIFNVTNKFHIIHTANNDRELGKIWEQSQLTVNFTFFNQTEGMHTVLPFIRELQ